MRGVRACVAVLGCAVLVLLAGCRPCASVADGWEAALRDELAVVGAGTQVDTGVGDHARLTLSSEAFRYAAAPLSEVEVFRPTNEQVAFAFGGRRAVLDGELLLRLTAVSLVPGDPEDPVERVVLLELQSVVVVVLDAYDRRATYTTTGSGVAIRAPLVFVDDEGAPTLSIDLENAVIDSVEFDAAGLPEGFASMPDVIASDLARTLVENALEAAPDRLSVFRFAPIQLGWAELTLAPSSLNVAADAGSVSLGVVTNLRPEGVLPDLRPRDATDFGDQPLFEYVVNPGLWRASLLHLHVIGRLPRRFNATGDADIDGAYGVVVREASLLTESVHLQLTGFCTSGNCSIKDYASSGPLMVTGDGVAVGLVPAGGSSGSVAPFVPATLAAGRDTARALLNPAPLGLQAARQLALEISSLETSPTAVRLRGSVVLQETDLY